MITVNLIDGVHPIPARSYHDPNREPTQREVSFFNDALAERGHRPLRMSSAERASLVNSLSRVSDFHQLFR